jgi:hypothetical protein
MHPPSLSTPVGGDETAVGDVVRASLQILTWSMQQATDLPTMQCHTALACVLKSHSSPAACPGSVPLRSLTLSRAIDFHHVNAAYTAMFAQLHASIPPNAPWSPHEAAIVSRWCEHGSDIIEAAKTSPFPLPADVVTAATAFIHRCKLSLATAAPAACPVCGSGMTGGWQSGPTPLSLICTSDHVSSLCAVTLDVLPEYDNCITCRCCGAGTSRQVLNAFSGDHYPILFQIMLKCIVCGCAP